MKKILTAVCCLLFAALFALPSASYAVTVPCWATTSLTYGHAFTRCQTGHYAVGARAASNNHYASCNLKTNLYIRAAASSSNQEWAYDYYEPGDDVNHTHLAYSGLQTR